MLINSDLPEGERRAPEHIKGQLKSVWKRRNQIAHEADVNPALAGVSLWPIDKIDTEITIDFIFSIGVHMAKVISEPLLESDAE